MIDYEKPTTVDQLTNSYCYYLKKQEKYIWGKAYDKSCDIDHYRAIVNKIIKPASYTPKKHNFQTRIQEIDTKVSIAKYVSNSCRRAAETEAMFRK